MKVGTHALPKSLKRSLVILAALALVIVIASSGALAAGLVLKDNFTRDDRKAPHDERWELVDVDDTDRVQIEDNTLEMAGEAGVAILHGFHSPEWTLSVEVAARNVSGGHFEVMVVSEDVEDNHKVKTYLAVGYEEGQGWYANAWLKGAEVTHDPANDVLDIDEWYVISMSVVEKKYTVGVAVRGASTDLWNRTDDIKPFEWENIAELEVAHADVNFDAFKMDDDKVRWQDTKDTDVSIGLFAIFFVVLLGPFLIKQIEHQLEVFLFSMGVLAVTVDTFLLDNVEPGGSGHSIEPVWSASIVEAGLMDPIMITMAVLVAGAVFHYGRNMFKTFIEKALLKIDLKIFIFIIVVALGLVASLITAIISALLLVEVVTVLKLDRKTETDLTVLACFSIGLGAALTPVGEPLSTIVIVTKLDEEFWFLAKEIGKFIIPSIIAIGAFAVYYVSRSHVDRDTLSEDKEEETIKAVPIRAFKVYLFVMALVFLGTGFAPIIEWYIKVLPAEVLYWVNMSSAILDNATLAAAEIVPAMTTEQLHAALMALLISGGMLIPGNIPNIICANKLHITSKEWARFGAPFGFVLMGVFFVILFILKL